MRPTHHHHHSSLSLTVPQEQPDHHLQYHHPTEGDQAATDFDIQAQSTIESQS